MLYLTPFPYKIVKMLHCFYNEYAKEPETLALRAKKSQKRAKKSQFFKI